MVGAEDVQQLPVELPMTVTYIHLSYEQYKRLEEQMRAFNETTHTSVPGQFYHKAIRLQIDDNLIMEFHGPLVRGDIVA